MIKERRGKQSLVYEAFPGRRVKMKHLLDLRWEALANSELRGQFQKAYWKDYTLDHILRASSTWLLSWIGFNFYLLYFLFSHLLFIQVLWRFSPIPPSTLYYQCPTMKAYCEDPRVLTDGSTWNLFVQRQLCVYKCISVFFFPLFVC